MAEEDLLPPDGEEQTPAPAEDVETPQQDDPVAKLASEMGWVPKEQFRGEPDAWRPADEFIRKGHEISRTLRDELRSTRSQVEQVARISEQLVEDKVQQRVRALESQLDQAVEDGDRDAAKRITAELRKAEVQQPAGVPQETQAWITRNAWFNADPLAQMRAMEVTERLSRMGKSTAEQLEAAEKIIRREFPEHFPVPTKAPPATQTAQARNPAPTNRQKGFADMPAEFQRTARDFEKRLGIKPEDFARSYWNDVAKQRKVG